MKSVRIFILFFFLISLADFCKAERCLTDIELRVYRDFLKEVKDTSFLISPRVFHLEPFRNETAINISRKYGFAKRFLLIESKDSVYAVDNKYFSVLPPDSLRKFENYEEEGYVIFEPLIYMIGKSYNKKSIFTFSELLFSIDNKYVILEFYNDCGQLCGYGETLIMKSTRNGWKIVQRIRASMS